MLKPTRLKLRYFNGVIDVSEYDMVHLERDPDVLEYRLMLTSMRYPNETRIIVVAPEELEYTERWLDSIRGSRRWW